MSFFNEAMVNALLSGRYICSQCGSKMEFEDEYEDTLICSKCGHSVDLDRYGSENDEDYDALYPTKEEVIGDYDDDVVEGREVYDEVCGELDND